MFRIAFVTLLAIVTPQIVLAETIEVSIPSYSAKVGVHEAHNSSSNIVIISLHSKKGGRRHSGNLALAKKLSKAGHTVYTPQMPWADYSATLQTAFKFLDALVQRVSSGNKRVVIAGHSQGATFGNLYTNAHNPHSAVIGNVILAPGHILHRSFKMQDATGKSVSKARKMIKGGKGSKRTRLMDLNKGESYSIKTTPDIYLTYFDLGTHPNFVSLLNNITLPTLWVDGEDDPLSHRMGYATMFQSFVPKSDKNRYVVVPGGHVDMMQNAHRPVIEWLKTL